MADTENNKSVFGGVTKFDGYFDAANQGKAVVKISRASGGNTDLDENSSFFVSSYQIQWQRAVSMIRPLNSTGLVAQVGRGTGTITLTGMVGALSEFKSVLDGGNVCDPLTITVDISTMRYKCEGTGSSEVNKDSQLKLTYCIPQVFQVTGQTEQQGMIIQQATLQCTIGGLEIGSGAAGGK